MLHITIPRTEFFDESTNMFIEIKEQKLQLEHSLVSLSKWESKWEKPFLDTDNKTTEEILDYIRCMTITQNVNPEVYYGLTDELVKVIVEYINARHTATWITKDESKKNKKEIITSEIIYYWMIELKIPFECQRWHLKRLLTLIEVCNEKNKPPKKMTKAEIIARNKRLNEERKKKLNSRG